MSIKEKVEKIKSIFREDYSELNEQQRFSRISMHKAPTEVYNYVKSHFDNLHIEIINKYEGNIMDLMNRGVLEGWCWQTTETASLFLDDESYIERGNLRFDKHRLYYHSWINFTYKEKEYVFDPCLQILCQKEYYSRIFEVEVIGRVTAREVKEYFIDYIANPPERKTDKKIISILRDIIGEEALERTKGEIVIRGKEDPNAPMYRNGVGYKTTLENGKIKKLIAHYYINDC